MLKPTDNYVQPGAAQRALGDERDDWETRTQTVQKYLDFCQTIVVPGVPGKNFFERECVRLARTICSALELWAVRPLQRHPNLPPPPYGSNLILSVAMRALEHFAHMASATDYNPYSWCAAGYVPWHPFAVLMSELCQQQPDVSLTERAWRVADELYRHIQVKVAEGAAGPLWTPIKKLMRKAEKNRPISMTQPNNLIPQLETMYSGFTPPVPSVESEVFDPAQFGYTNVETTHQYLPVPSDQFWQPPTPGAVMHPMSQDPSWNEWSMFMDNLYTPQPHNNDNMWMGAQNQHMFESAPAPKPDATEPTIYSWAA